MDFTRRIEIDTTYDDAIYPQHRTAGPASRGTAATRLDRLIRFPLPAQRDRRL